MSIQKRTVYTVYGKDFLSHEAAVAYCEDKFADYIKKLWTQYDLPFSKYSGFTAALVYDKNLIVNMLEFSTAKEISHAECVCDCD